MGIKNGGKVSGNGTGTENRIEGLIGPEVADAVDPASLKRGSGRNDPKEIKDVLIIPPIEIGTFKVPIVGDSPLIVNRFDEKSIQQMEEKQQGKAVQKKAPKDPEECFRRSLYIRPDGTYGFPAIAFKAAAVTACTSVSAMTKVQARQAFHIVGDLILIKGVPVMRRDHVRNATGVADIRYRAMFEEWSCELTIRYNARVITPEQIINLLNNAGFGVGVGEWRSEKDGGFGLFHVE